MRSDVFARGCQVIADTAKISSEHRVSQAAGECVLLARMVTRENAGKLAREFEDCAMAEGELRLCRNDAAIFEDSKISC